MQEKPNEESVPKFWCRTFFLMALLWVKQADLHKSRLLILVKVLDFL